MFTAVLYTIPKIEKHPRCPSTSEWIKELLYLYTRECYRVIDIDQVEIIAFAATGNGQLSEVRQRKTKTKRYH